MYCHRRRRGDEDIDALEEGLLPWAELEEAVAEPSLFLQASQAVDKSMLHPRGSLGGRSSLLMATELAPQQSVRSNQQANGGEYYCHPALETVHSQLAEY